MASKNYQAMIRKIFLCAILFSCALNAAPQPNASNSSTVADTNAVNSLLALSKENFSKDTAKAIAYSLQAKQLAEKLNFQKGVALALKNIGIVNYMQGKDVEA